MLSVRFRGQERFLCDLLSFTPSTTLTTSTPFTTSTTFPSYPLYHFYPFSHGLETRNLKRENDAMTPGASKLPITEVTLRDQEGKNISVKLSARIDEKGNLVLYGYDCGDRVKEFWGASDDYEYWLTIPKEYKDTVLLWLIKDRFDSDETFRTWLESKGIPCTLDCWV